LSTAFFALLFSARFLVVERSRRSVVGMGRNRGFTAALIQIQRQAEREARARAAAERRATVEAERARKAYERSRVADEKERARLYAEARVAEVAALNEQLTADAAALERILPDTLDVDDFLDFEALKEVVPRPTFDPGPFGIP
jgi:restriction system protein